MELESATITLDEFETLTSHLLVTSNHNDDRRAWKLIKTPAKGRGIQATRNIATNELIFTESALLSGPIFIATDHYQCVTCHIRTASPSVCPGNCGLQLCHNHPECMDKHKAECNLITSWNPINGNEIRPFIIRALTAIRALLLGEHDMSLLQLLQANRVARNERSISDVKREFQRPPSKKTVDFLQRVVAVLNTNAFQVVNGDGTVQLKGLYALAGQLNHDCRPNTRHCFDDDDGKLSVYATRPIGIDEELTTSYTNLLWNTQSRKTHLQMTKQFTCLCKRCQDRTEFGTKLSALKCFRKDCVAGDLLPMEVGGAWQCDVCADIVEMGKIRNVQEVLASYVAQKVRMSPIRSLIDEISGGMLRRMAGERNQFCVELKLQVVWKLNVMAAGEEDLYI